MGQINVGIGNYTTPTAGTSGYGFNAQGKPIYIDAIGVAHELYSDVSVEGVSANVLANIGVGLEADLPTASAGFTYVTSDTFKIYQGIDTGVYDISDLTAGQFVTDTYAIEHKTYQFIGTELMPVSGGGSTVTICDQADVELAEPTENTKATSSLRAWQGFVFWCKNTLFPELNTSDKTIIGSVNELKTNVVKLESDETPEAIADTDNVRFKSGTGYYVRTLLAIKNYVKSGLKASDVANDSTKVTGATVKDVFDNAEEAVLATTVQDSDMFAGMRWENIGTGIETYNKYWTAEDMKAYFATSGAVFVATEQELTEAFASEKETMQICATAGITSGSISNVYAGNLWITGRKLIFNSGLITPNSSSGRAVTRVFFDASVTMIGSAGDGFTRILVTSGIWHFTFRNLSQDLPIRFTVTASSEVHFVCGNTITVDPASTGTYTVTQDSTLDLGHDDVRLDGSNIFDVGAAVDASTEVLIKANTGFVTLATLGALASTITGSDRKAIVTTIERIVDNTELIEIASTPTGWELDYIDIKRIDNTGLAIGLSLVAEYEDSTMYQINAFTEQQAIAQGYTQRHSYYMQVNIGAGNYEIAGLYKIWVNNYGTNKKLYATRSSGVWPIGTTLEFRTVIKRTL